MFVFIKPAYPIPATGSVRPKNQKKISPSDRSRKCTTQKTRKSIETNVKRLAVRGKRLSFEIPCSFGLTILPTAHFSTVFVIYILNRGGGGRGRGKDDDSTGNKCARDRETVVHSSVSRFIAFLDCSFTFFFKMIFILRV